MPSQRYWCQKNILRFFCKNEACVNCGTLKDTTLIWLQTACQTTFYKTSSDSLSDSFSDSFIRQPMLSTTLPLHFDAGDIHLSVAWIKISKISWDTRPFHLAFKFGVQLRQSTQKNVVKKLHFILMPVIIIYQHSLRSGVCFPTKCLYISGDFNRISSRVTRL